MRLKIIGFLKRHPRTLAVFWAFARFVLKICGSMVPVKKNSMLFSSLGGRGYSDSPKAIYDEVCSRKEFDDWTLVWAFVEPEAFSVPRGSKVKIDTVPFFKALLRCEVWVSNSGMDRGIGIPRKKTLKVETWHGAPLKKIGGEENCTSMLIADKKATTLDCKTLRCAQSEYDLKIFMRVFHAPESAFLLSDLPRNDKLLNYTPSEITDIKKQLRISDDKIVILYTPTYREYDFDKHGNIQFIPPFDLEKWRYELGTSCVLLFRAHYAVSAALHIEDNSFVRNVTNYPSLNDLYIISDLMISDYSSTYFDYSILQRPMLCYAYDLDIYEEQRGLYCKLEDMLPCPVDTEENVLIERIKHLDWELYSDKAAAFHQQYTPYSGRASAAVVDEIEKRVSI